MKIQSATKLVVGKSTLVIMDYYEDGDLEMLRKSFLKDTKVIPKEIVKKGARQLFSSLRDLHAKDIVHRDIKPENVLGEGKGTTLKFTDFGCARQGTDDLKVFSPLYVSLEDAAIMQKFGDGISPERKALRSIQSMKASDVFGLTLLLHILNGTADPKLKTKTADQILKSRQAILKAFKKGPQQGLNALCVHLGVNCDETGKRFKESDDEYDEIIRMGLYPEGTRPTAEAMAAMLEHMPEDQAVDTHAAPPEQLFTRLEPTKACSSDSLTDSGRGDPKPIPEGLLKPEVLPEATVLPKTEVLPQKATKKRKKCCRSTCITS